MSKWVKRFLLLFMASLILVAPIFSNAFAASNVEIETQDPGAGAMAYDLFLLRPVSAVATVGGSIVWVLGLPFSVLGGNVQKSGEKLVADPLKYTFARPLGNF